MLHNSQRKTDVLQQSVRIIGATVHNNDNVAHVLMYTANDIHNRSGVIVRRNQGTNMLL